MAETFAWTESNSGGETVTNPITKLDFGSTDAADLNVSTHPITFGQSSFEKYIRAKFTGSFTTISNMLFWKDSGAYVAGEGIKCAYNATFGTPSQTPNADPAVPTTSGGSTAIQSYEGASTITIGSGISGYTKYLRLQLDTTVSTPSGSVNQKTFKFQYDVV